MIKCKLCKRHFKLITNTHLKAIHKYSVKLYINKFGIKDCHIASPALLPKSDLRYRKWRKSLLKRPPCWAKGYTKYTHPSVLKISQTMKHKKIDNFNKWRIAMKKSGKIKSTYKPLPRNKHTAELIGLVLGDGNLYKHERTERLTISFNNKYPQIIKKGRYLIVKSFQKEPIIEKSKTSNGTRMWIYEKYISQRLGIPCGAKRNYNLSIPAWIFKSDPLLKSCLIGLFNSEGSYTVHKPTYTYNLQFSNTNVSLLDSVFRALKMLKYNPERREKAVRLRRKAEAEKFVKEINFRFYRS